MTTNNLLLWVVIKWSLNQYQCGLSTVQVTVLVDVRSAKTVVCFGELTFQNSFHS